MEKTDIKALKAKMSYNSFELQYLKFNCDKSKY
jgi:hypothetical protein